MNSTIGMCFQPEFESVVLLSTTVPWSWMAWDPTAQAEGAEGTARGVAMATS